MISNILAGLAALLMTASPGTNIDRLWDAFDKAEREDKPQEELKILNSIKEEAQQQRRAWDFYRACEKLRDVSVSRDWKKQKELAVWMTEELKAYDDPVLLVYHWKRVDDEWPADFLEQNRDRLLKSSHREFWENDWRVSSYGYGEALVENFENDYDYACWVARKDAFEGRYPLGALMEYFRLKDGQAPRKAFIEKYKGKAAALLAKRDLLWERYSELEDNGGKSDDYLALKADCIEFNRERSSFSGKEKTIAHACSDIESLLGQLEAEDLEAVVENGVLVISFQNLGRANAVIRKEGKEIFRKSFDNPVGSFHCKDTVRYTLPDFDDGEYELLCSAGKNKVESRYPKHTLSVAIKRDAKGAHAFVADYMSGEPVGGKAYVGIPQGTESYQYAFKDAGGRLRSTEEVSVRTSPYVQNIKEDKSLKCTILTDKPVYSRKERICFKAILYRGTYALAGAGAGIPLEAQLIDPDGGKTTRKLTTNDFGSAAGYFDIPSSGRNGRHRILVIADGNTVQSEYVSVEDLVPPSYDVVFDEGPEEVFEEMPDSLEVGGNIISFSGHPLSGARLHYSVTSYYTDDNSLEGDVVPDANGRFIVKFPTSGRRSFTVSVKVTDATGETLEFNKFISCYRYLKEEQEDGKERSYYFEEPDPKGLSLKIVAADKPVWAVVDIYGLGNELLDERMVHFEPVGGRAETTVSYAYPDSYPDVVTLQCVYFQNGQCYSHSLSRRRETAVWDLPLSLSRFTDTARPGQEYSLHIETGAATECALTVFDKALESIMESEWCNIRPYSLPAPSPWLDRRSGANNSEYARFKLAGAGRMYTTKASNQSVMLADDMEIVEEEMLFEAPVPSPAPVVIRKDFATALAWEPCLHSDADGNIDYKLRTGDKLSTFVVQVFAHNKAMQSEVVRKELVVTIPVKIEVLGPSFLYLGDSYNVRAVVSNSTGHDISGRVIFNDSESVRLTVPAHGQADAAYRIIASEEGPLPLKAVFASDDSALGSDGILLEIPVYKAEQTITESHSALLIPGRDKDETVRALRSQFVNLPGEEAVMREISILDMVKEALPEEVEPRHDDLISLCKALLSRRMLQQFTLQGGAAIPLRSKKEGEAPLGDGGSPSTDEELMRKVEACRNADGGYAWFAGMDSSPVITAVALESLKELLPEAEQAVKFLDRSFFKEDRPLWRGGLSLEQYLHVRSQFAQVPFTEKVGSEARKGIRKYLVPGGERGLNAQVFHKARRIETLRSLASSEEGISLARKLGVTLFAASRIAKSEAKDMQSLAQYAVQHPSGGVYFPNAVMPWRGLLESELYAHNMLSRLFDGYDGSISNGIRLWTMIQKETQDWGSDPAYIEAIQNVLKAPEDILATKVLALSGSFSKPFDGIRAAGNGFSISRACPSEGKVGDILTVEYTIRNDENRSFVRFSLPFPAGLTPVRQLSGRFAWNSYREVKSDSIEYWFDSYPEETTTIREEFFVTREGEFQCPVPVVECSYADHYRANGDAQPNLTTQR